MPAAAAPAAGGRDDWAPQVGPVLINAAKMFAFQYVARQAINYFFPNILGQPQGLVKPVVVEKAVEVTGADGVVTTVTTTLTSTPSAASTISSDSAVNNQAGGQPSSAATPKPKIIAGLAWQPGTPMSMFLYVNTIQNITPSALAETTPVVVWDGLTYGNFTDNRLENIILDVPETVRAHNGSWWMDILLVKDGGVDPRGKKLSDIAYHRKELTRWMPKRVVRKEKSLLAADDNDDDDEPVTVDGTPIEAGKTIVSHWSRNLTLTVISNPDPKEDLSAVPPPVAAYYQRGPDSEDGTPTVNPIIFPNDFWIMKDSLQEINQTTTQLPLQVEYKAIGNMKFKIFATLAVSFQQSASSQPGAEAGFDEVKRMFAETNPILLITTFVVTILHMLFEVLAFSSDIGHWRNKENLVGVSLRSIILSVVTQTIVMLYLYDSSEETSAMILLTQGMGVLVEAWKVTKILDIKVQSDPTSLIGYRVTFEDKHVLSEEEKKTQQYDKEAFRVTSYFAIPVLLGYAVYSLLYKEHRGWWSYIIQTAASANYLFGFASLIPQLLVNYKLKSVAHIPMKAMIYKTLSTVVDDFFAFCVKMPWLHRLACFRDDAVFVVLLYQWWIYGVDYSRANEYGQQLQEDEAKRLQALEDKKRGKDQVGAKGESKKDK